MPIKFACPECKAVMSVADSMAGKKGKCKCGAQITVPAPTQVKSSSGSQTKSSKSSATSESSGSLMQVFDELTDADYNRESPMQKIYAKQAAKNEGATLKRFNKDGDDIKKKQAPRAKPGVLNGTAKFLIVGCVLLVAAMIAMIVLLAMNHASLKQVEGFVAQVKMGTGLGIAFFALSTVVWIACAVGLILKQLWGWILTAAAMTCAMIERLVGFGMSFTGGVEQTKLIGGLIPLVVASIFVVLIYKRDSRRIFKVESTAAIGIAVGIGIVLAGIAVGLMFGVGAYGSAAKA